MKLTFAGICGGPGACRGGLEKTMEFLFAFLIVVGLITVIGHGIWVLLRTIFRAMFGEAEPSPALSETPSVIQKPQSFRCVNCGAESQAGDVFCAVCGQAQSGA